MRVLALEVYEEPDQTGNARRKQKKKEREEFN